MLPNPKIDPTGRTYLLQKALADLGYYHGKLDNWRGPKTDEAEAEWLADMMRHQPDRFNETKSAVGNRGVPPDSFLSELVAWGRSAPDDIFAVNDDPGDVFQRVELKLGPLRYSVTRRAAMLELQRVLAGLESSWN